MNLNWPDHPPVRIYDIGLDAETLAHLRDNEYPVVRVPEFCLHWRKHFTWKIWCLNDAKSEFFLWMDAGLLVIQPLPEVFEAINRIGYFIVPNYQPLDLEASSKACSGCGLPKNFRQGKITFAGGLLGFKLNNKNKQLLNEALRAALDEENIRATKETHRHDQALLSLLLYKYYHNPIFSDGTVYLGGQSPNQVPVQKVWVHRRRLLPADQRYLISKISGEGPPFRPIPPEEHAKQEIIVRRMARSIYYWVIRRIVKRILPTRPKIPLEPYDGVREE